MSISTSVTLDYAHRCAKAVRAAIATAADENNFDSLIAIDIVLAVAFTRRRGQMSKTNFTPFLTET